MHYLILATYIRYFQQKYQMLFMTDIVFNHTSFDNPLLVSYPEISFNNMNTPQLLPAIELDLVIEQISEEFESKAFAICSEDDIQIVLQAIAQQLQSIRFHEYWLVGFDVILHSLSSSFTIQSQSNETPIRDDDLYELFCDCLIEGNQGHRFSITIDSRM